MEKAIALTYFTSNRKTLYNYFLNCLEAVYIKARRQAIQKTGLPPKIFSEKCPFTPKDIFNSEYFPE